MWVQQIHDELRAGAEDAGVPLEIADALFAAALARRCPPRIKFVG
jgi:hypothetical protein